MRTRPHRNQQKPLHRYLVVLAADDPLRRGLRYCGHAHSKTMSDTQTQEPTYRIETTLSAGEIADPITDEAHTVSDGIIEVSRPDSARALVTSHNHLSYADSEPTEKEVEAAQLERFDFADCETAVQFARQNGTAVFDESLDAKTGFDPKTDAPTNDPRMKALQMYESLQEAGYQSEAKYLRVLPSTSRQEEFVKYVREELDL